MKLMSFVNVPLIVEAIAGILSAGETGMMSYKCCLNMGERLKRLLWYFLRKYTSSRASCGISVNEIN